MITRASGDDRSAQLAHEALHALIAAREPVPVNQILPDAHRVAAPRQLQLDHLAIRFTGTCRALAIRSGGAVTPGKKPVVTSLAGFELSSGFGPPESRWSLLWPVLNWSQPPQPFAEACAPTSRRHAVPLPADRKYPPAVSRRTPVACSIRRRDQPSRPSAITCSCFVLSKTLPMPTEAKFPRRSSCLRSFSMAGFELTLYGRIWVTPKSVSNTGRTRQIFSLTSTKDRSSCR
jgi:hypothetical protein